MTRTLLYIRSSDRHGSKTKLTGATTKNLPGVHNCQKHWQLDPWHDNTQKTYLVQSS